MSSSQASSSSDLPNVLAQARSRRQGVWWILTIPHCDFVPYLPPGVRFIQGQAEEGSGTGFRHWQICLCLSKKGSLATISRIFGTGLHAELTRSSAAREYCLKPETRIEG